VDCAGAGWDPLTSDAVVAVDPCSSVEDWPAVEDWDELLSLCVVAGCAAALLPDAAVVAG
jgi:hypothetical protein